MGSNDYRYASDSILNEGTRYRTGCVSSILFTSVIQEQACLDLVPAVAAAAVVAGTDAAAAVAVDGEE